MPEEKSNLYFCYVIPSPSLFILRNKTFWLWEISNIYKSGEKGMMNAHIPVTHLQPFPRGQPISFLFPLPALQMILEQISDTYPCLQLILTVCGSYVL